jgi:hypothetical protein
MSGRAGPPRLQGQAVALGNPLRVVLAGLQEVLVDDLGLLPGSGSDS